MKNSAKVFIAGAGPGDPGLITVRAFEILKKADVILYDKLANSEFLKSAKEDCELIFVGKEAGRHYVTQENTIELLIAKAKEGKTVLRLKGGDPFIFGRGSEEALALKAEGITYEIIPGITAGAAASTYAGIPLTHRELVAQTVFLTAHESPFKPGTQIDWERLAGMKNSNLVIYMGASLIPEIVHKLVDFGMDPKTPSALIENATLPCQRTIDAELIDMPAKAREYNIHSPSIFFIGPSVGLRPELKWYEDKPLFNKRIVSARAEDQSASLYKKLTNLGAQTIALKLIKTIHSDVKKNLGEYLTKNKFDWIIFSSENGVRYFFDTLRQHGLDSRIIANCKIAVIGSGTALRLSSYYLNADFIPSKFTSESFVEEFTSKEKIESSKILRVKGDFRNDMISDALRAKGIELDTLEVYKLLSDKPDDIVISDLKERGADAYAFTSKSTVDHFFNILGEKEAFRLLSKSKVISIGPVSNAALRAYKVNHSVNPPIYTVDGIVGTLLKIFEKK